MTETHITCIMCPLACQITVTADGADIEDIKGFQCTRGREYAVNEFRHPTRVLTATVRTDNPRHPLLAVRSDAPLPKAKLADAMYELAAVVLQEPVSFGDVVVADIAGTGHNMIATQALEARHS